LTVDDKENIKIDNVRVILVIRNETNYVIFLLKEVIFENIIG